MATIIKLKIDVTKLDKERFFKGSKGTYADLVIREVEPGEYGDTHIVSQDLTKEEREQNKVLPADKKKRMPIIGNGRAFTFNDTPRQASSNNSPAPATTPTPSKEDDSDLPF